MYLSSPYRPLPVLPYELVRGDDIERYGPKSQHIYQYHLIPFLFHATVYLSLSMVL